MRHYIVLAVSVISRYGEHKQGGRVTEADFYQGIAEELVGTGALERDYEDDVEARIDPGPVEVRETGVRINEITRIKIMSELSEAGIIYSQNESKIELFEKWKSKR